MRAIKGWLIEGIILFCLNTHVEQDASPYDTDQGSMNPLRCVSQAMENATHLYVLYCLLTN